jgi:glycosyltransferase involved in cell wall biosynthesis
MSKIYLNGRFLTQRTTGVQRYAREIVLAMDTLLARSAVEPMELELLAPHGTEMPPLRAIRTRAVGPLRGHAWEQVALPALVGKRLLLSFGPTGPVLKRRQIVTIHDAAVHRVPDSYGWRFRVFYRCLLPLLARRSPYLMTVSEFSKREVVQCFGAEPATTRVSGEGWQHLSEVDGDASVLSEQGLEKERYVLAVGSVAPHKNFRVIAQAARYLSDAGTRVVVVGAIGTDAFADAERAELTSLTLLGHVSDAKLKTLYENAAAFVHPSLYEGFGIPPLEAMALGCPVIAARAAAIPEVCGPAALYFEPDDARTLAALIERVSREPALRAQLREHARVRLAEYSWERAALSHLALLREALRDERPRESA